MNVNIKKFRIIVSILRRLGIDLDRGHRWDLVAKFYHDINFQKSIRNFLTQFISKYENTQNSLLLSRARTPSQIFESKALLGSHYTLLKTISQMMNARNVIDIGTYTGMSAISFLDAGCMVKSFDIVSPFQFEDCILLPEDLSQNKIELINANLFDDVVFSNHQSDLINADIIFLDGPKFGGFEEKVLPKILKLDFKKETIIIVDDIYIKSMKVLWDSLECPRIDLALFGHVSGTGILFPNYKGEIVFSENG
jgi:predicted O-methyltransferase YrrM